MANIPSPRAALVDREGKIAAEWYRWLAQFERELDDSETGAGAGLELSGGDLSISTGGVTRGMLADGLSTSVVGRYQGSDGPVADIQAVADDRIFGRFGGILEFRDISLVPATVADADYGDITVSSSGAAWAIDADAVTNAKMANMVQATIKGRASGAGTGDPTDLTAAQARAIILTDGQALTRVDDTNVTLTLGGTPATALLAAVSLTLGWTGTLSVARGGTGGGSASGTLVDNISGWSSTGIIARTGAGTYAFRTIAGTANQITVTNGSGVSGDPTLSLPSAITFPGSGTFTTDLTVNGSATLGDAAGDALNVNATASFLPRIQLFAGATARGGTTFQMNDATNSSSAAFAFDGTNTTLNKPLSVTGTGSFSGGIGSTTATTQSAGDNSTKVSTTAYVRQAGSFAVYRTVAEASGSHIAGRVAGTYFFGEGDALAISGTGTLYPPVLIYIDSADFPTVDGLSPKLRVEAIVAVNDTAPGGGGSFTFGLHPVTTPATSGAAGVRIWTVGSAVASSTTAFATPAADSAARQVSSDFALPSNGLYVLGMVSSATVNGSSHMHMTARLHMRYA